MVQSEESLSLRAQKNWNPPMLLPLPTDFLRLTPPPHQVRRTTFVIVLLMHGKYESGMTFAFHIASWVSECLWVIILMQCGGRKLGEKTEVWPLAASCIQGILQVFILQNTWIGECTRPISDDQFFAYLLGQHSVLLLCQILLVTWHSVGPFQKH